MGKKLSRFPPETWDSPATGVRARLGVPGQAWWREWSGRASSVMSPALDVCLAHKVGFQLGHNDADDPHKDEEVYLQRKMRILSRHPLFSQFFPWLYPRTPVLQGHSPQWQREWAVG